MTRCVLQVVRIVGDTKHRCKRPQIGIGKQIAADGVQTSSNGRESGRSGTRTEYQQGLHVSLSSEDWSLESILLFILVMILIVIPEPARNSAYSIRNMLQKDEILIMKGEGIRR